MAERLMPRRGSSPAAAGGTSSRGIPLSVIQRQLDHSNLGITSVYMQGIDNHEIIDTVHARRAPTLRASAGLQR